MNETGTVELLAPAGDVQALEAALATGADAVYLGLERWSARAYAANFSAAGLLAAIDRAHLFGARVHVALNTQLKGRELGVALATLAEPYRAGLDALIVADLGFAALVRERYPDLQLHASTQLNTHSSAQLALLHRAGFRRAILARELSVAEIAALDPAGLELEAFVHGALCYGYSGLCLFSSMIGGRSGNRGRCSQACRMRYRLAVGERRGAPGRALSTSDLAALGALPALLRAGVTSFKIEGRMKDASYVAVATAVYREAIDAAVADPDGYEVRSEWLARLEQSFSRGFTTAHLEGRHSTVRSRDRGGRRGVAVGRVEALDEETGYVTVRLTEELAEGDVVQLYTPWGHTEPVRVAAAVVGRGPYRERIRLRLRERVALKDRLFRLSAQREDDFVRAALGGRHLARPVPLRACLSGRLGEPPRLTVEADGQRVERRAEHALAAAQRAALSEPRASEAIGALGGTPYRLVAFEYAVEPGAFLGVGELKALRRDALADLQERRLAKWRRPAPPASPAARAGPHAVVGERLVQDLEVVVRLRPGEKPPPVGVVQRLCLDLAVRDDPDTVAAALARLQGAGWRVRCRPPEILFDADCGWWSAVRELPWEAVYARHAAHLEVPAPAILEYPLHGLNGEVARRLGASAVVASPEASLAEIAALGHASLEVEVFVAGRQQLLVSRDELGRAEGLLGARAADETEVSVLDGKGFAFPASVAREETRLFNARLTNMAANVDELCAAGVTAAIVVQRDLSEAERAAFVAHGLAALGAFAGRARSTTAHLFRGVS